MSSIPTRLIEFLNEQKVRYQVIHHPEAFTAQELAAIEHVKGQYHAKVVIALAGSAPLMLVLPASHRVDLDKLAKAIGRPAVVATENQFKTLFPDCAVGTMPPFGHLYGLATHVDRALTGDEFIVFEAGTHSDAIKLSYADFSRLARAAVADFAVKLH